MTKALEHKTRTMVRGWLASVSMVALGASLGTPVSAQEEPSARRLDEITVTATRRAESQQAVAVTVQTLGEEALENLRVASFDDYVALVPGVNASGQGPGKNDVFIRGITPSPGAVRVAALGSEPSVALYLDETPISTGARNIDLYAVDLGRIEVLKGPQGTLFGASSQAGTIRLITNKPDPSGFAAGGVAEAASTRGGDISTTIEGYINIPVIEDRFAVRVAAYNAVEGGFIDNVPGTRQIALSNPTLAAFGIVPGTRVESDNADFVEDDFNEATYQGFRASALYQFNDDWQAQVQHTSQTLEIEGIFEFEPDISEGDDLNVQAFSPDVGDDEVQLTSWTVEGRAAGLDLIYNGSYSERTFDGFADYTGYAAVGPFIPYYICDYPTFSFCGSPVLTTQSFFETERLTQEARFATDDSRRWRVIGGVFYDDLDTTERTDYIYPASIEVGFQPNFPIPDAFASNPDVRAPGITFFNDFLRTREEFSVFGEFSFDILDNLTATIGARNYDIEIGLTGQSSFGQRFPGPEADAGNNVDEILAGQTPTTLSDTIYKANLSWQVTEDALLYATYSEGFRGGGFNRNGTGDGPNDIPFFFDTDDVLNYEIGWKTEWMNNTVRLNGAAFFVDFTDLQQGVLDFTISNLAFFDNVGSAESMGLELEAEWAATNELTLFGSATFLDSELTEVPDTLVNIAPLGSELPFSPKLQTVAGARYERDWRGYTVFGQGVLQYTDVRFTTLQLDARERLDPYNNLDLSAGVARDQWRATLFVDNVGDSLGEITAGAPDDVFRVVPTRPRTVGIRLGFDY